MLRRPRGSRHITTPNFLESGPSAAEILGFFDFPTAAAAILEFLISKILLTVRVHMADAHHRSKSRQNW